MSDAPEVSVIVTVYDRVKYLSHALKSAIDQTYRSVEIIVTDDSDSDEIRCIVASFNNPLIRYRCNPSTLGVALNLRAGINEARGRYIAILNDDDLWEPEFLTELVKKLDLDQRGVLSFCDHWIISESGELDIQKSDHNTALYGRDVLPEGIVTNPVGLLLERNGIPLAMAALFRKDAINWEMLVKEVSGAYDFWISCLLVSTGRPIYYTPQRLTRYRVHGAMETARRSPDKNENMVYIYSKLKDMPCFIDKKALLTNRYKQALFQSGKDNLHFNRIEIARAYFFRSWKVKKNFKAIVGLSISYLPRKIRTILKLTKQ